MGDVSRVLWYLDIWDRNPDSLEDAILFVMDELDAEEKEFGVDRNSEVRVNLQETANSVSGITASDFKFDKLEIEDTDELSALHIELPIVNRKPVKYSKERKPS